MWRKSVTLLAVVLAVLVAGSTSMAQQQVQRDNSRDDDNYNYDSDYNDRDGSRDQDDGRSNYIRVDRNLDADIWVNRSDNEYFIGDNIKMHYRLNADAYVSVISIDSRGRVNLLYPSQPGDNPWRRGGVTYTLPGADDDFDFAVDGPEGTETIQIIASHDRFAIPNWYNGSGIICRDDEDRDEFMDYLVSRYFDRLPEQRFAVDREVIWVNEWERDYFRPVYYPTYPAWSVYGNMYFDYPWGASIYVDGIYWGCAPLYIPRILVGWRTITVYDPYGYCWEDYVHVSHYNTVILNQTVIRPRPSVVSKYKEVRVVGYRDPVKSGYPNYNEVVKKQSRVVAKTTVDPRNGVTSSKRTEVDASNFAALSKKHVRGDGAVIKTDRGYESSTIGGRSEKRATADRQTTKSRFDGDRSGSSDLGNNSRTERKTSSTGSGTYDANRKSGTSKSSGSADYYRKKSGKVEKKSGSSSGSTVERKERQQSQPQQVEQRKTEKSGSDNNSGSKSGGEVKQRSSGSSSGSSGSTKQSTPRSSGGQTSSKGKSRN
jgi:hypothetical protein